ncbi:MAG TPA: hypothetical protein VFC73_05095 [Syntrophomonadaceae bacterium]|nr:hypothetical protein [Syntrophomonadaceae bacterium]
MKNRIILMAMGMSLIILTLKTIAFWFVIGLIGVGAGFAMPIEGKEIFTDDLLPENNSN